MFATPSLSFYCPAGLDIEALLRADRGPVPAAKQKVADWQVVTAADKYRFVVDHIYKYQRLCRVDEGTVRRELFAPVHFDLLGQYVGQKYTQQLLADLRRWGVIESDGRWARGHKSVGYRLTTTWRTARHQQVMCLYDRFEERVTGLRAQQQAEARAAHAGGVEATLRANLEALSVDFTAARAFIHERLRHTYRTINPEAIDAAYEVIYRKTESRLKRLKTPRARRLLEAYFLVQLQAGWKMTYAEYRARLRRKDEALLAAIDTLYTREAYECDVLALEALQAGEYRLTRDEYGRVHTNLTNLSSQLRQFLYNWQYPAKPLVNVDLKNSQPLFLAALVKARYAMQEGTPADVREYVALAESGRLYETLMAQNGIPASRRADFKVGVYTSVFFGREKHANAYREAFATSFPTVAAYISEIKAENYRNLATRLQGVESHLVIDTVVPRLAAQGIWSSTIHDSFVCFAEHAEVVQQVICEAFAEAHGLVPSLKVEALQPVPMAVSQPPVVLAVAA